MTSKDKQNLAAFMHMIAVMALFVGAFLVAASANSERQVQQDRYEQWRDSTPRIAFTPVPSVREGK